MKCVWWLSLAAVVVLAGCASEGPRVNDYLDPQTGVTIRTIAVPLIYAHEAPELAANTRDYLSLGVVEVNNMGTRKHYLAVVSWSTITRKRPGVGAAPVPERIEIASGGKSREFKPIGHEARSLGIGSAQFHPPSGYAGETWYAVTPAELRALAAATPDSIALLEESGTITYQAWEAGGEALAEFVRDIPDTVTAERKSR